MISVIIDSFFYSLTIEISLRVSRAQGDFKSLLYLTNSPTVIQFMMIYHRITQQILIFELEATYNTHNMNKTYKRRNNKNFLLPMKTLIH